MNLDQLTLAVSGYDHRSRRIRTLEQVVGALIRQIEALGSVAAVSDLALAADPLPYQSVYNAQRRLFYLHGNTRDDVSVAE